MSTIDTLRRDLRNFRNVAFNAYDTLEAAPASVLNRLAITIDNRTLRENPVRLEEVFYFPEVHAWEDEIEAMGDLSRIEFTIPMKGWSAYVPFNAVNIGRPHTVATLERIVPRLPEAYFRKQVSLTMSVFRANPLAYDGQNFFDTDHAHPGSNGQYSNVLTPAWVDKDDPSFDEVKAFVHAVRARFVANLSIQSEVLETGEVMQKNLLFVTHNATHWSMFDRVRTQTLFDGVPNELVGGFQLLQDAKPTSGEEHYVEAVIGDPAGPRPTFLVNDQDPELDAWETDLVRNGYVAVGMKGIFGVKPAFPQSAVQGRPTTI